MNPKRIHARRAGPRRLAPAATFAAVLLAPGQAYAAEEPAAVNWVAIGVVIGIGILIPLIFLAASKVSEIGKDEPDEDIELVVAGIGQGAAPVPRWLYLAYVLIPLYAAVYLITTPEAPAEIAPPPAVATPTPEATPPPEPTPFQPGPVEIAAENISFDVDEFTLVAGEQAEIRFENRDSGVPHNIAIYTDETRTDQVFEGDLVTGPGRTTYTFTAPEEPGEYYFQCQPHPGMNGTVHVVEAD